ncbi:hypothetical protein JF634_00460 [Simonsiella muelleri]|uniref:PIN domain-containing protein n=1 Tax=Simonsiella muelleri ATCC 29453 TaxID=641147 RepID=V9HMR5_9NEIS|nr:hypothetical protein [Simonsiella muelleri]AUX61936.1 hypothetical protein BWP33_09075 [Simonsiella muelleri ATCC 29453]EFG31575.1 hypothetical protein HMPREF9021_00847 [Simonsiella muelleri ATCC 29453]UBQ54029.1 hypothetical protein JF634_00460 [Simonsiella muelleri]
MYLLDTNIFRELRLLPKGKANPNVAAWAQSIQTNQFFTNVVVEMEIERGVLGAIDNSKKEAKDLRYCFHATIPNLCHVPKHAYK